MVARPHSRLGFKLASPIADVTPEKSFLDVLSTGEATSSNFLAVLITLLRASLPTHAFEVHGLLQGRADPQRCGITVYAMRLPGKAAGLVEVWDKTWEGAARKAADGVVAAILPRTRYCRGPWAAWQRFAAPPELFTAYREAADFEQQRRYDEALGRSRLVIDEDPDLESLRKRPEFKAFAALYFPGRSDLGVPLLGDAPSVDPNAVAAEPEIESSRTRSSENEYAQCLIVTLAGRWHHLWHERANRDAIVDGHTLMRWWDEEREIWDLFAAVARTPCDLAAAPESRRPGQRDRRARGRGADRRHLRPASRPAAVRRSREPAHHRRRSAPRQATARALGRARQPSVTVR